MTPLALATAFGMGLAGSLHCAGMCGPVMWVMPFQRMQGARKAVGIGLYHLGRISVYAALGLALRSFSNLFNPEVQRYVSLACGAALLVAGILSFLPRTGSAAQVPWSTWVKNRLSGFMGNPAPAALFATGALNGLLPCGLVYMALSAAIVVPTVTDSLMMVYAFGLGTVPMLLAITLLKGRTMITRALKFRVAAPFIMAVFGCLFILRGANLGIPYLSPKIESTCTGVKASCCHK
jgi:sulfite exporter TauE/SafE